MERKIKVLEREELNLQQEKLNTKELHQKIVTYIENNISTKKYKIHKQ